MANYRELLAQREALDKQIEESRKAELGAAVAQVRQLITDWNMTAEDCGFKAGGSAARKMKQATTVVAKYKGPNGEVWSGRGKSPRWLAALEQAGRQRNEFLVS